MKSDTAEPYTVEPDTAESDTVKDALGELGALALGSRLKRLSDCLMQEGVRVYEKAGIGFEPRWFPVYSYLYRKGPTAITALARGLGVSHPGINKIANELIEVKLVAPYRDRNDKRKRVLALTSHGRDKYKQLEPVWRGIRQALQSAVDEGGGDFLRSLSRLERNFGERGFLDRFSEQWEREEIEVLIRGFTPRLAPAFKSLNEAWIRNYFTIEEAARKVLDDPEGTVIAGGGDILFAVDAVTDEVLGTVALVRLDDDVLQLAMMAVCDAAKGRQIGRRLGESALARAREMGAAILFLESNRKLNPAINLYHKLGFVEKPFPRDSDCSRADFYMELAL